VQKPCCVPPPLVSAVVLVSPPRSSTPRKPTNHRQYQCTAPMGWDNKPRPYQWISASVSAMFRYKYVMCMSTDQNNACGSESTNRQSAVHSVQRRVELQTSMFCLLVFVWPRTSVHRRRHTSGLPPTDRVPFHAHTTHSATGASLSPSHVFGTVFRPTCATRTLHTPVSGMNSKCFVLMLLPGRNETFVNCAI